MDDEPNLTMEQKVAKIEAREVDRDQKINAIFDILTQNPT
jgi:hypothetical protein